MTCNFRKAWEALQPSDMEFGRRAYPVYHAICRAWAKHYGFGFVQTVEAFAALSPNADYHSNIRSLSSCMDGLNRGLPDDRITASTYGTMKRKALAYLRGDLSFLDETTGPKITAFRNCILYPETAKTPVIDGHMVGLWAGQGMTMREAAQALQRAGYGRIAGDLSRVAKSAKAPVAATQAALWAFSKRTRSVRYDTQLSLFHDGTAWDRIPHPDDYPPYAEKDAP